MKSSSIVGGGMESYPDWPEGIITVNEFWKSKEGLLLTLGFIYKNGLLTIYFLRPQFYNLEIKMFL